MWFLSHTIHVSRAQQPNVDSGYCIGHRVHAGGHPEETAKLRGNENTVRGPGGKDCLRGRDQKGRTPLFVRLLAPKEEANEEQVMSARPRDTHLSL